MIGGGASTAIAWNLLLYDGVTVETTVINGKATIRIWPPWTTKETVTRLVSREIARSRPHYTIYSRPSQPRSIKKPKPRGMAAGSPRMTKTRRLSGSGRRPLERASSCSSSLATMTALRSPRSQRVPLGKPRRVPPASR